MRVMIENNLTALPVVDKENRLRGFITLRDLLNPREPRYMPPLPPRGLITAVVTPLNPEGGLDWASLRGLLENLLPFCDAFLIGEPLAGEGLFLPEKMRLDLFRGCCEEVGGRKPLFLCPTAQTSEETLSLATAGEKFLGALPGDSPVFWADLPLWHHSNRKLPDFYEEWGQRSPLSILLYNHPLLISSLNRTLKRKNIRTSGHRRAARRVAARVRARL